MREEPQELWKRYRETRDIADRNRLAEFYVGYVYDIASKAFPHLDYDERCSAAHFFLLAAIETFANLDYASFYYFLRRRISWDLRDHFYKNRDCPDRALRHGVTYEKLHENIPDRCSPTPFEYTAAWSAVHAVSPEYQELVLRTVVNAERISDIADEKDCSYNTIAYKRHAALQAMRTGNRAWRPWTHFLPGYLRRELAREHG
jgi:DNA-directed RNA polymerase specialized sigma subunit